MIGSLTRCYRRESESSLNLLANYTLGTATVVLTLTGGGTKGRGGGGGGGGEVCDR